MMKCCVCGRQGGDEDFTTILLTEPEKASVRKLGVEPDEKYIYCEPCIRILRNREAGARLMQGVARNHLSSLGHPSPDEASEKVYEAMRGKR